MTYFPVKVQGLCFWLLLFTTLSCGESSFFCYVCFYNGPLISTLQDNNAVIWKVYIFIMLLNEDNWGWTMQESMEWLKIFYLLWSVFGNWNSLGSVSACLYSCWHFLLKSRYREIPWEYFGIGITYISLMGKFCGLTNFKRNQAIPPVHFNQDNLFKVFFQLFLAVCLDIYFFLNLVHWLNLLDSGYKLRHTRHKINKGARSIMPTSTTIEWLM